MKLQLKPRETIKASLKPNLALMDQIYLIYYKFFFSDFFLLILDE